mmetsp:Transcript_5165/g.15452  ORF Transcript_5165/g.15452 Transcript_5165/m.15452 type:complete len:241 (+) Transcript_5165:586-1308(+)
MSVVSAATDFKKQIEACVGAIPRHFFRSPLGGVARVALSPSSGQAGESVPSRAYSIVCCVHASVGVYGKIIGVPQSGCVHENVTVSVPSCGYETALEVCSALWGGTVSPESWGLDVCYQDCSSQSLLGKSEDSQEPVCRSRAGIASLSDIQPAIWAKVNIVHAVCSIRARKPDDHVRQPIQVWPAQSRDSRAVCPVAFLSALGMSKPKASASTGPVWIVCDSQQQTFFGKWPVDSPAEVS